MKTATVGSPVSVLVDPRVNNGEALAAGVVTKVVEVDDEEKNETRVNLRVFLDTGSDLRLTNVLLLESKPERIGAHNGNLAYWPPRD